MIFLAVLGLCAMRGLYLVVAGGIHTPVAVCGLLIVVASFIADYRI